MNKTELALTFVFSEIFFEKQSLLSTHVLLCQIMNWKENYCPKIFFAIDFWVI